MAECKVHKIALTEALIPISYGLHRPPERWKQARRALFPNANSSIPGGCVVHSSRPKMTRGAFCPKCREVEEEWLRRPSPLAGIDVGGKDDLLADLEKARADLAAQAARVAEALFSAALEVAWIQQRINLLARQYGVGDPDICETRVDLLLHDMFAEAVREAGDSLPRLKQVHYVEVYRHGWAG
jgi:hypothetical protein